MDEDLDDLIISLLEWLESGPRPYAEVVSAWRTSCPRLPVWEEVTALGLVQRHHERGQEPLVSLSEAGLVFLGEHRSQPPARPAVRVGATEVSASG
jgi:hypothetical protein